MIIVGTFFILLAYNFIDKYLETERGKELAASKNSLRTALITVGTTSGIEDTKLDLLPNFFESSTVKIVCNDKLPILFINGKADTQSELLRKIPTFMTEIDEGKLDTTYLAVESFRLPFKVSNLIAIVSKSNYIYFDNRTEIGKELLIKFRKSSYKNLTYLSDDFADLSTLASELKKRKVSSVVLVSDGTQGLSSSNLEVFGDNVYLVNIMKDEDSLYSGTIEYITKKETVSYPYIDVGERLALPTMAVFSSPEAFECAYALLEEETTAVLSYYILKAKVFLSELETSENKILCRSIDNSFEQTFLYEAVLTQLEELNEIFESTKFNNPGELEDHIEALQKAEDELGEFSCPYVY